MVNGEVTRNCISLYIMALIGIVLTYFRVSFLNVLIFSYVLF